VSGQQDSDERGKKAKKGEPRKPLRVLRWVEFAYVAMAAIGVYSFVAVAKEGESRRRCSATCLLRPNYAGSERVAPSFQLQDTSGQEVSLDAYKGKVIVLNFWTRTCGPCMEEMPEIAELARVVQPMGDVAVLTISTDETAKEAMLAASSALQEMPPFPILMDPEGKSAAQKFGTKLFPETWIIDKKGFIRARFDGTREWSSAAVIEFIEPIRTGSGTCEVQVNESGFEGKDAHVCELIEGG
jgi:peroxiredoxin